ncbi:MAG: hypothetical protein ACC726_03240 [Chloroflexota bacterium]
MSHDCRTIQPIGHYQSDLCGKASVPHHEGNPINGVGFELQAITAVFLGGAATAGGRGTIVGTVLAVLLVGVLNNGMNLLGVGTFYQRVALGVLLIGAVALSQWRQGRAERARTRVAASG